MKVLASMSTTIADDSTSSIEEGRTGGDNLHWSALIRILPYARYTSLHSSGAYASRKTSTHHAHMLSISPLIWRISVYLCIYVYVYAYAYAKYISTHLAYICIYICIYPYVSLSPCQITFAHNMLPRSSLLDVLDTKMFICVRCLDTSIHPWNIWIHTQISS